MLLKLYVVFLMDFNAAFDWISRGRELFAGKTSLFDTLACWKDAVQLKCVVAGF
jgi:hypothetical protein